MSVCTAILSLDPGQRAGEHHLLTERMAWAFDSTFVLPLTDPLPGGSAVERLALAFLYAMPGKKLVRPPADDGARLLTGQLNHLYRSRPALHQTDPWREGFQWIEPDGGAHGVVAFARTDRSSQVTVLFVANFGPEERTGYRLAVPHAGLWKEALNTDARDYGGAGTWQPRRRAFGACSLARTAGFHCRHVAALEWHLFLGPGQVSKPFP